MNRLRLESALDAAEDYARAHGAVKGRDPREPGRRHKAKAEARMQAIVQRHFRRQAKRLREWLALNPPAQKVALPLSLDDALEYDDDFEAEALRAMLDFTKDGVSMFGQTVDIGLDYTLTNTRAAKWARAYVGRLIKGIDDTTRQAVREAVASFVETPGMTLGDVMARLPFDEQRAQAVAVTEVTRAYGQATLEAAAQLREEYPDVRVTVRWNTNNDDRVCPICRPLDGAEVDEGDSFTDDAGGEPVYGPPAHVNCLPGDTFVSAIGRIAAVSERQYDGNLIVVNTAGNKHLTCTPNHPILTRRGWIPASLLYIGDDVISYPLFKRPTIGYTDYQDVPTRIHQIAETFRSSCQVLTTPMPITAEDFHGDGKDSDIAVIYSNRLLGNKSHITLGKHVCDFDFSFRSAKHGLLAPYCSINFLGDSSFTSANSIMGSFGLIRPLSLSHISPFDCLCFGLCSWNDIVSEKHATNSPSIDTTVFSQLIFGLSGNVSFDKIVSISQDYFSGHVYNLQTGSGIYSANGIITHNCRCWTSARTRING